MNSPAGMGSPGPRTSTYSWVTLISPVQIGPDCVEFTPASRLSIFDQVQSLLVSGFFDHSLEYLEYVVVRVCFVDD